MSHTSVISTTAERRIAELGEAYPLPAAWRLADTLIQTTRVGALELQLVGLVAQSKTDEASALGAAAAVNQQPVDRAYFELLERISVLEARRTTDALCVRDSDQRELAWRSAAQMFPSDASATRRLSLSNGVGLHVTWADACHAALRELVERDRVLRSWRGECPAQLLLEPQADMLERALAPHYRVRVYEFAGGSHALALRVVGVFLFPTSPDAPLTYGFAAAEDIPRAIRGAEREALQRLAFLWGEAVPTAAPEPSSAPDYHQDYYLYPPHHAHLRAWLDQPMQRVRSRAVYDGELTRFIDITPAGLHGKLSVAKAYSPHARRLRFGPARAGLPPHPIV